MDVKVDSACMREDGLPDPALIDPLLFRAARTGILGYQPV